MSYNHHIWNASSGSLHVALRRRALEAQRLEASEAAAQLQLAREKERHWRQELHEAEVDGLCNIGLYLI